MNRNVSIVVAILVLVVIAGYLIWLKNKVQPTIPVVQVTPTPAPTMTASPSATPSEATGAARQQISTPGAVRR